MYWHCDGESPSSPSGFMQLRADILSARLLLSFLRYGADKGTRSSSVIHAVESRHGGKSDSSVLYIPAAPLTKANATYLAAQRARFEAGKPAPDFPGGAGESEFVGRAGKGDVHAGSGEAGLRALGFAPFVPQEGETEGGKRVIEEANRILGFA